MAVPTHFKFTFRGVFLGTPEIWSFGMHFSRTATGNPDAEVTDIDQSAVTAALTGLLTGGGLAPFNQYTEATDWRAYQIGTDGKMEGNPLVVDVSAAHIKGPGGVKLPPQIALVVTTVASDRGPGRFGRFYLPGPSQTMEADFRLSETNATAYAEAATNFLKAVSDAIDMPGGIDSSECVNISARPAPNGTIQVVDHVEVGKVYDTLRTRRNKMLEERHVHGQIDW